MSDCKYCNNNRYIVYYGNIGVCADCSDDLSLSSIFQMQTIRIQRLQEENKLLRECVELILESKPVEDILSDKNKMFSWNMGLIVKAKQTLAKIKGDE